VDNVEKCSKYRYIGVLAVDKAVDKKAYLSTQSTAIRLSLLKALIYPQIIHRVIHRVGAVIHRVIHRKISKI
jgi:hypothetical protein